MIRSFLSHVSVLYFLLAVTILPAWSQEALTEQAVPEEQTAATETRSFSGIEIGSLRLLPELTVSGMYDDNIYATRTDTAGDRILHLFPSLELKSNWSKHAFGLNLISKACHNVGSRSASTQGGFAQAQFA